MNLVPASTRDLETVVTWVTTMDECKQWAGARVTYPIEMEVFQKEIKYSHKNSFVLHDRKIVVAFGQLLEIDSTKCHMARVIVLPTGQGMGYGKKICNNLVERAIQLNCKEVSLNVFKENQNALGLYGRLGFNTISEDAASGTLKMVKSLTKP